jgi:hypothetical protein
MVGYTFLDQTFDDVVVFSFHVIVGICTGMMSSCSNSVRLMERQLLLPTFSQLSSTAGVGQVAFLQVLHCILSEKHFLC